LATPRQTGKWAKYDGFNENSTCWQKIGRLTESYNFGCNASYLVCDPLDTDPPFAAQTTAAQIPRSQPYGKSIS